MNRLTRYWQYAVFGLLIPGIVLFIVFAWKSIWSGPPNRSWELLGDFAGILCWGGLLMWLCLTIGRVGSDVTKLWKTSKAGTLLTFTAIAVMALALQRFAGPHFYGWHGDAWLFFCLALLLGSHLLLRISVALTGARRN